MRYQELPIEKVELDLENPRIKQYIEIFKVVTSEGLSLALTGSSYKNAQGKYAALRESIRAKGGIFTPIIVNHITSEDRYIVIEGNTRLKFYQEFYEKDKDEKWSKIMCIVYDDMDDNQKHAIRLQAHMVGARDWDAFSKAKYLDYLYNTEKKSLKYLKDFCGGQESRILNLINAYRDMVDFYIPVQEKLGETFDPTYFSYYEELQKSGAKEALKSHDYTEEDFSLWAIKKKIDRAENVRKLARVLGDQDSKKVFLQTGNTLSDGIKVLESKDIDTKKIEKTDLYITICSICKRLRSLNFNEVTRLAKDPKYEINKQYIYDLKDEIENLIDSIEDLQ